MEDIRQTAKKWQTIYPTYLNSKVTIEGGRRVPKAKAVENPTCEEIADVLTYLKLGHVIEPDKAYPRNWMQKGRVKVLLKDEHGQLFHPEITNKIENLLMLKLCELIPKLKSRVNKGVETAAAAKPAGGKKRRK